MEVEDPYFDQNGKEIKQFAVLKVFHFKGVNEQGRGQKNYYMYKWVKLKEIAGKIYWVAFHLDSENKNNYYNLKVVANKKRMILNAEIVQQPN